MIAKLYQSYLSTKKVFIDSREAAQGGIFFAVGQTDAEGIHKSCAYAIQALEAGADYAVINSPAVYNQNPDYQSRLFLTNNGEQCLQMLAAHHRRQLKIPVVAIAGSNGKTTTKELLARLLPHRYNCFVTPRNLNNHLGVPLSILQINDSHEIAVLEIGANHLNETLALCQIARPSYGLVTNNGKDHLGEYGSIENIRRANAELYDYLRAHKGTAFVNANNNELMQRSAQVPQREYYGAGSSFYAELLTEPFLSFNLCYNNQKTLVTSALFGGYWAETLLGAAFVAHYFGINIETIAQELSAYKPQNLRGETRFWENNRLLLDCYNANPSSMSAFLQAIQTQTPTTGENSTVLVLGEMLELGVFAAQEHQQLIDSINFDLYAHVFLIGAEFGKIKLPAQAKLQHLSNAAELKTVLQRLNLQHHNIMVKGSRGNRLETAFDLNA